MSDNLPAVPRAECPIQRFDIEVDQIVRWAVSGATREHHRAVWQLINVPSARQREILQTRLTSLASALKHGNQRRIAKACSDLLDCWRNAVKPGEEPSRVVAKYAQELQDLPDWAVDLACIKIRMGITDANRAARTSSTAANVSMAGSDGSTPNS